MQKEGVRVLYGRRRLPRVTGAQDIMTDGNGAGRIKFKMLSVKEGLVKLCLQLMSRINIRKPLHKLVHLVIQIVLRLRGF